MCIHKLHAMDNMHILMFEIRSMPKLGTGFKN